MVAGIHGAPFDPGVPCEAEEHFEVWEKRSAENR